MIYNPWIDELARKEWESIIEGGSRPFDIFEWGCGNSTLWFGLKRIGEVWSVEHDYAWATSILEKINSMELKNIHLLHIPSIYEKECLHSNVIPNFNFENYVNSINIINKKFDFILVDGRARVMCFKNACEYVKTNGHIVLHDAERNNYKECNFFALDRGFKTRHIVEERTTLICQK